MKYKNVAIIVHPLTTWGGAEYNLAVMAGIFHEPTIYTAWFDKKFTEENLPNLEVKSSYLQNIPFKKKLNRFLVPLHMFAYRSLDLSEHDLIIVISDGFEKFIKKPEGTDLIHYVLTPARFLWMNKSSYRGRGVFYLLYKKVLSMWLHKWWKKLDKKYAKQSDLTLAISEAVQKRIAKYYTVDSKVVYPPVDVGKMKFNRSVEAREEWFLYLGRVESYKGVDLAIKACIETDSRLKVAGTGKELEQMKELVEKLGAKHLVGFLGFVSEKMKRELFYKCRALLYPVNDEDFGIVPVEANASGCPVIAYKSGGVMETIKNGETGVLFDDRSVESLEEAIKDYRKMSFSADECKKQASSFSREMFENKMRNEVNGLSKR